MPEESQNILESAQVYDDGAEQLPADGGGTVTTLPSEGVNEVEPGQVVYHPFCNSPNVLDNSTAQNLKE